MLVFVFLLACDDERPPPDRGIPLSTATPPSADVLDPFERPRPDPRPVQTGPYVPQPRQERVQVTTPGTPGTPGVTESALARELKAAAGTPDGCGELEPTQGELRIPLRATVAANGYVTSASVGGNLPGAVRGCMEDRIERHRFSAAPSTGLESVSAELVIGARTTVVREERTVEERFGLGTGFELQNGQRAIDTSGAPIAPAPGAREIAPAPGATEIAPPPSTAIGGPSGVSIMGPGGRAIGE